MLWSATPSGTATSVEFWIDGVLKSSSSTAPYLYNGDGVLDPATLSAGAHTLMVKATDSSGHTAVAVVSLMVPAKFASWRISRCFCRPRCGRQKHPQADRLRPSGHARDSGGGAVSHGTRRPGLRPAQPVGEAMLPEQPLEPPAIEVALQLRLGEPESLVGGRELVGAALRSPFESACPESALRDSRSRRGSSGDPPRRPPRTRVNSRGSRSGRSRARVAMR